MTDTAPGVTVITCTFNDWDCLVHLLPRIDRELAAMGCGGEVVIVDDGSVDTEAKATVAALSLTAITRVRAVTLLRNLGNQRALAIGVAFAADRGCADHVVLMDSDHEDDPRYIPELIGRCAALQDRKVVFAERTKRSEGRMFQFSYALFQRLYRTFTGQSIAIGNFSVIPRALIRRVASIAELWNHYPAAIMRARVPFDSIPSARAKRLLGKSKTSLVPLVIHALSGFSVHAETIGARVLLFALALGSGVVAVMMLALGLKIFTDIPLLGWTSQFIGVMAVLLFQLVITTLIMTFIVISVRMQIPFIPLVEYSKLIDTVEDLQGDQSPATPG